MLWIDYITYFSHFADHSDLEVYNSLQDPNPTYARLLIYLLQG
jgi:hypothetical protein